MLKLVFQTQATGAATADRMTIKSDGNVGIGTASPSAKLHVYTSATLYQLWGNNSVVRSNTGSHGLRIYNNDSGGSSLVVQDDGGSNTAFIVKGGTAGNVGIGTATPSVKLDVSSTDAIKVPVGTTAQRPTAADGMIRFNSTTSKYEGYRDSAWKELGGGVIDLDEDTYVSTEKTSDDDTLFFYTAGVERAKISDQGDAFIANDLTITGTASAATPTQNGHLTTKLYVDNADSSLQSQITNNDTDITALNTAHLSTQHGDRKSPDASHG